MAYWVAVCESATNPGVVAGGPGANSVACGTTGGTMQALEVQLMVVPPAGSSYDGLWQLGAMSIDNALVISAAICGLWALAWGIRQLAQSFSTRDDSGEV